MNRDTLLVALVVALVLTLLWKLHTTGTRVSMLESLAVFGEKGAPATPTASGDE